MDRLEQLRSYSIEELVSEIQRRKAELDGALARIGAGSAEGRSPARSAAKAAYWAEWHSYRANHPDATVEEWRKAKASQKRKR